MQIDEIKALIEQGIAGSEAKVSGDGYHYDAVVISDAFAGKSPLQKQKMVYATLSSHITSGAIHALGIKAYTPEEWAKQS